MKKTIYFLAVLLALLCCKNNKQLDDVESQDDTMESSISEVIENFKDGLKDGDTLIIDFNMAMEQYIRVDTIFIEKRQDNILINSTVNEKIEEIDDKFSTHYSNTIDYNHNTKDSLSLEHFLKKNLYRTDNKNSLVYTLKIHFKNDSITFYTYNLTDKAQLIKQYFNTMKVIYPNEKLFANQENVFPLINK